MAKQVLFNIAFCQASFLLGIVLWIFVKYFDTTKVNDLNFHVLTISVSYTLLTIATCISIVKKLYPVGDFWYWIVLTAYAVGDISLLVLLKKLYDRGRLKIQTINKLKKKKRL